MIFVLILLLQEEIIEYLRNTNALKEKTIEKLKQDMGLQRESLLSEKNEIKNTLEHSIKGNIFYIKINKNTLGLIKFIF